MSQTAIPLQFEQYMQNQISAGLTPDMNEMIFAYIPDLDLTQPISRDQGLPNVETWVHQQDVDQVGKIGANALAYSVVIVGTVPSFTFNAIYLHDKNTLNSCGMIVFKPEETKETGMTSTKSLLQSYIGAAETAGITVDAETWQIDYQARLIGIEEDHRLACIDNYGHAAFIEGFEIIPQTDPNKFKITAGLAYIGGLRIELENEVIQTITTKPTSIYLDVVRSGTALSKWENQLTIEATNTMRSDYVDSNNEQHYVSKLAEINKEGTIEDERVFGGTLVFERVDNAATNDDVNNKSLAEKHVKLPQFWFGISNEIKKLTSSIFFTSAQAQPWDKDRVYKTGETCTKEINNEVIHFEMYRGPNATCIGKDPADLTNRQDGWTDETAPFYWTLAKKSRPGTSLWPWMSMTIPEGTLNVLGNSVPAVVFWRVALALPEFVNAETGMIDFPETGGGVFQGVRPR